MIGHYGKETPLGTIGGFKVERYVDAAGHECAYYDTTLMYPTNLLDEEAGVNVLDMSDPRQPEADRQRLITPAMLSPARVGGALGEARHPRRRLRQRRLRRRESSTSTTSPQDCRHPVLRSTTRPWASSATRAGWRPTARPSTRPRRATSTIVAVDISDPTRALPLWYGQLRLARPLDLRRRQPRLRRRHRLRADHPRHLRDPGPGAEPDRARGRAAEVGVDEHPPERDPDHRQRPPLSGRDRRVRRREHGGRSAPAGSSTSPTRRSRAWSPTCGSRCTSPRTSPRRRTIPGAQIAGPGLRRPLLQRARPHRPADRRLLDDHLGPARLRHPRPREPEGDRLLQRADPEARYARLRGLELGDGEPLVRPRAQRDLVLGRLQRLPRRPAD